MTRIWEMVALEQLGKITSSKRIFKSEYVDTGIPFYRTKEIKELANGREISTELYISNDRFEEIKRQFGTPKTGDLLITAIGTIGEIYVVNNTNFYFKDGNVLWLRDFRDIEPYFLKYSLMAFIDQLNNISHGSAYQALPIEKLKKHKIAKPPLSEQKRIVAILDEAFEGIDRAIANTEKNLANARELFESYLNSKLLATASSNPTQTILCITDLIVDCEHKTAPKQETGIPLIRTPNIGKGYLIFDNVNRVSEETYELWTRRAKPEPGDLILAREAPAGNVGVIPEGQRVCLGQRTVLIRPKKEIANSQYLAFLLLHPIMQRRLLAHSTGATVQHVNMKDIRGLPISNLPPIQTQIVCLRELEQAKLQVTRLEAIYRQKIVALNELKQSILQKAFTGELTADNANQMKKTAKEGIAA